MRRKGPSAALRAAQIGSALEGKFPLGVDQPSHRQIGQVCELCSGARV